MGLHVVALISGGKDSMYSMLHCVEQGHRIVALANLYPPDTGNDRSIDASQEDLNSFMFQTAGHRIISLYAKALELPLYRQEIVGAAAHTAKDYTPSAVAGDETEDLFALLAKVTATHPEINAVSTGAILSTYQRTRVESVALRLGLVPLGYLWQYPTISPDPSPSALLRHMAAVDLDARIVKVASGGLDESVLWTNVCEARTINRLEKAMGRFGGSVLGEGGEFETLVISGPPPLWKGKLLFGEEDKSVVKSDAGESFLNFKKGSVLESSQEHPSTPVLPRLFDDKFRQVLDRIDVAALSQECEPKGTTSIISACAPSDLQATSLEENGFVYINNISSSRISAQDAAEGQGHGGASVIRQSKEVCTQLLSNLSSHGLNASSIIHTTILLRSMSDFAHVNEVYGKLFVDPLPPARVTVACGETLPANTHVVISVTAQPKTSNRKGLHVQTRSYWAPANIGPYSQARSVPTAYGHSLVFVAGQIPLVPASMANHETNTETPSAEFAESAALSLQHLWRVGTEQNVGMWTGAVAYLAASDDFKQRANIAREIWTEAQLPQNSPNDEEDEASDVDVWDQRNRGGQSWAVAEETIRPLPDFKRLASSSMASNDSLWEFTTPGFLAVEVAELPRQCSIEWQSTGLASHSDDETYWTRSFDDDGAFSTEISTCEVKFWENASETSPSTFKITEFAFDDDARTHASLRSAAEDGFMITVFSTPSFKMPEGLICRHIPCRRISGLSGKQLAAGALLERIDSLVSTLRD